MLPWTCTTSPMFDVPAENFPRTYKLLENFTVPCTSSFSDGFPVPMPKLPVVPSSFTPTPELLVHDPITMPIEGALGANPLNNNKES